MNIIDAETIDALLASGHVDEAVIGLIQAAELLPSDVWPFRKLGKVLASLGKLDEAASALMRGLQIDLFDLESLLGLYEVEQIRGNIEAALAFQSRALALAPVLACRPLLAHPPGRQRLPLARKCRVLMLCIPGTYQANNPLEYIVDGESIELYKWFLTAEQTPPLPEYDVIFNAIGYAHGVESVLRQAEQFIASQDKICINAPKHIDITSRAAVTQRFLDSSSVVTAPTRRLSRAQVKSLPVSEPLLLRPLNSQAGSHFAKISYESELQAYLASVPEVDEFYQSPFIEYVNRDGYYRKYRIVFIDHVPYPVHLAISSQWMVHYYNSLMASHQWMRNEEEAFMRDMHTVFHETADAGLQEIAQAFPLEYFAIDCSITAEGRVLLFEADTAMIVHMGDPISLYPYKHRYIPRIIDALDKLFSRSSATANSDVKTLFVIS